MASSSACRFTEYAVIIGVSANNTLILSMTAHRHPSNEVLRQRSNVKGHRFRWTMQTM